MRIGGGADVCKGGAERGGGEEGAGRGGCMIYDVLWLSRDIMYAWRPRCVGFA